MMRRQARSSRQVTGRRELHDLDCRACPVRQDRQTGGAQIALADCRSCRGLTERQLDTSPEADLLRLIIRDHREHSVWDARKTRRARRHGQENLLSGPGDEEDVHPVTLLTIVVHLRRLLLSEEVLDLVDPREGMGTFRSAWGFPKRHMNLDDNVHEVHCRWSRAWSHLPTPALGAPRGAANPHEPDNTRLRRSLARAGAARTAAECGLSRWQSRRAITALKNIYAEREWPPLIWTREADYHFCANEPELENWERAWISERLTQFRRMLTGTLGPHLQLFPHSA